MDKTTVSTAMTRFARPVARTKAYSVQMRGGSVRFQAQTLRKIRIPFADSRERLSVREGATLGYCRPTQPPLAAPVGVP